MFWAVLAVRFVALQTATDATPPPPPPTPDGQALVLALTEHRWTLAGALAIYLFVGLVKQGWAGGAMQRMLPARVIPFVAPVLGVLGVAAAEIISGKHWSGALLDGAAAGILAVFTHQSVVEGALGGKEPIPARVPAPPPPPPSQPTDKPTPTEGKGALRISERPA